jgi:hypothetical protein
MYSQKLLSNSLVLVIIFLLTAPLFTGCSKEKKASGYAVRVNDSYLSENEVKERTGYDSLNPAVRTEYIQNWVRSELLYQKAISEGVTKQDEYNYLLNKAKKEIAAALLTKKVSDDFKVKFNENDLKKYYDQHPEYFRINDIGFLFDQVTFSDEKRATTFREIAVSKGWGIALHSIGDKNDLSEINTGIFRLEPQLETGVLYRVIHFLNENEISLVLHTSPAVYTVVRLKKTFQQGSTPPFSTIKNTVEERMLNQKKVELLDEYIKELYDNNKVDITYQH